MRPRLSQLPPTASRPRGPIIAVLAMVGMLALAIGAVQVLGLPSLPSLSGHAGHRADGLRRSTPTRISIPSLGVRARVVEVGRAADGSIDTPGANTPGANTPGADAAETAGWYRQGPTPGEWGTAVIVGHVDTADRPAVFHNLRDLRKGKYVEVRRQDRRVATFVVDSVESFPKTAFPADRIFAASAKPRLVLVTCGGQWLGGDVGYADNVIAFATLV